MSAWWFCPFLQSFFFPFFFAHTHTQILSQAPMNQSSSHNEIISAAIAQILTLTKTHTKLLPSEYTYSWDVLSVDSLISYNIQIFFAHMFIYSDSFISVSFLSFSQSTLSSWLCTLNPSERLHNAHSYSKQQQIYGLPSFLFCVCVRVSFPLTIFFWELCQICLATFAAVAKMHTIFIILTTALKIQWIFCGFSSKISTCWNDAIALH